MKPTRRDALTAGRSHICPFDPNESALERHQRRQHTAQKHEEDLRAWCEAQQLSLTVSEDQTHWTISGKNIKGEWFPASALLTLSTRPRYRIHCHDYHQVILLIGVELAKQIEDAL